MSEPIAYVEMPSRRGGRPRTVPLLSRIAALVGGLLFCAWMLFYVKYMTSSESKTLVSPHRTRIERLDRICAESGGGCYVVSDFVDSKMNAAWRAIRSEKATNSSQMESHFSRAALIVQNDTTSSKDWSVDHSTILAQYIAVMAALPFATGSLLKAKPTILSIGLGGGVLDMFLHTARPKFEITVVESDPTIIDIAHKWFGVEETTNRKTVNASGIDFLSNTVKNGRQYDVVFVDACDLSSDNVTCPSAPFLDRANIADISDSLPTSGVVVVNVVARSGLTEKLYDRVFDAYMFYFKMCLKANMPSGNIVVACTRTVRHGDENLLRGDASVCLALQTCLPERLLRPVWPCPHFAWLRTRRPVVHRP